MNFIAYVGRRCFWKKGPQMSNGHDLTIAAWFSVNVALALIALLMAQRARREAALRREEQTLRDELDAYAGLDPKVTPGESPRALARRVCATVAQQSAFRQVAMLTRDAENRLCVVGSAGADDLMISAVTQWGARRKDRPPAERRKSYAVTLGPLDAFDATVTLGLRGCRQVIILPMWSQDGGMLGALAVWPPVDGDLALEETLRPLTPKLMPCSRVIAPLEALALKLGRAFDMAQMSDRMLRAEKMAGLGHLAKGVAHELNNPLTAVLGFAELIAETAAEPRVREDAVAIAAQAMRMKETVDSLLQFWRPVAPSESPVDVAAMLHGLVEQAKVELLRRGVRLVLVAEGNETCVVRGDEGRLLEVLEHLLNNAAQAVAVFPDVKLRSIRVTLSCDEARVRVVVSDSGKGFTDAGRVFDPFYTTRQPGDGQGMGLAVSYGIVREHGGDISAFNVYPHGAAVVVELPVATTVKEVAEVIAMRGR
jgi:signal transduction histidine kinase